MSRIREIEDQIPTHLSKQVQDKIRKHLLDEYHAREQCSTCRWWTRGGLGMGRGGGYCLQWRIAKNPANKITHETHGCWEPKHVLTSLLTAEEST